MSAGLVNVTFGYGVGGGRIGLRGSELWAAEQRPDGRGGL
jgi:hypothetical protein